jgi:hypothetical protein
MPLLNFTSTVFASNRFLGLTQRRIKASQIVFLFQLIKNKGGLLLFT